MAEAERREAELRAARDAAEQALLEAQEAAANQAAWMEGSNEEAARLRARVEELEASNEAMRESAAGTACWFAVRT